MPPTNNEILPVQAQLLDEKFTHEKSEKTGDVVNSLEGKGDYENHEWEKFMFIIANGAFFRLFVNTLSQDNAIRRIWDRVARGPLSALQALGIDPAQFATTKEMREYIQYRDPETYALLTEASLELERHYGQFRDELKDYMDKVDPEASTALTEAIEQGNIRVASLIIETYGNIHNRIEE